MLRLNREAGAGFVGVDDGHAVDGARFVVASGWVHHVASANEWTDVGLRRAAPFRTGKQRRESRRSQ